VAEDTRLELGQVLNEPRTLDAVVNTPSSSKGKVGINGGQDEREDRAVVGGIQN
jgi:hypothetical protein